VSWCRERDASSQRAEARADLARVARRAQRYATACRRGNHGRRGDRSPRSAGASRMPVERVLRSPLRRAACRG
jgi:hypothetical protein